MSPAGDWPASLAKETTHGDGTSVDVVTAVYVATPELLASAGLTADDIDPTADIVSPVTSAVCTWKRAGVTRRFPRCRRSTSRCTRRSRPR